MAKKGHVDGENDEKTWDGMEFLQYFHDVIMGVIWLAIVVDEDAEALP